MCRIVQGTLNDYGQVGYKEGSMLWSDSVLGRVTKTNISDMDMDVVGMVGQFIIYSTNERLTWRIILMEMRTILT